jgi:murein DD-endopeptidase MepM/ murein hydrolase activator NlpD
MAKRPKTGLMQRRAVAAAAVLVVTVLLTASLPASAQEPPPTDDSSTTTEITVEPTTTTEAPTTTTTEGTGDATSTTFVNGEPPPGAPPPPVDDPTANSDAPGEAVPIDSTAVPPRSGFYANQQPFDVAMAVRGELRVAKADALRTQAEHDLAVAQVHALEAKVASLQEKLATLRVSQRQAVEALAAAKEALDERAAVAYMRGGVDPSAVLFESNDGSDFQNRRVLMQSVLGADQQALEKVKVAKAKVGKDMATVADQLLSTDRDLTKAQQQEQQTNTAAQAASFDLAVFSAGGQIAIHGFTFPVGDPHSFVDTFGAPRLMGTPYAHWHEGNDIMAPLGTPLFAVEHGIVSKVGSNLLGGNSLWIKGESGTYYYYAHLSAYAPDLVQGMVVDPGHVVGFVGNTGDAAGGPTHLHFEIHPDGGPAVDPYPLLKTVDDLRRKAQATSPTTTG